jgi:hypothetical protein
MQREVNYGSLALVTERRNGYRRTADTVTLGLKEGERTLLVLATVLLQVTPSPLLSIARMPVLYCMKVEELVWILSCQEYATDGRQDIVPVDGS